MYTIMFETIYNNHGTIITFDEETDVIRIGLKCCPSNEEIDRMWTVLSTFINNHVYKCILHLVHVETQQLEPPGLQTMMHIVSTILSEHKELASQCRRIFIQPKYIDDKVRFAQQLFLKLMPSTLKITIASDQSVIDDAMQQIANRGRRRKEN